MSGVAIVRYLLANNTTLTAAVPSARIMAGVLPLNTLLPAISVLEIDGFPRLNVAMTGTQRQIVERVQVTVLTKDYPSKKTILALVRAALPLSRGTVNGISCDSVLPDLIGPDLDDPDTGIYSQSRDYMVRWNE